MIVPIQERKTLALWIAVVKEGLTIRLLFQSSGEMVLQEHALDAFPAIPRNLVPALKSLEIAENLVGAIVDTLVMSNLKDDTLEDGSLFFGPTTSRTDPEVMK